MSVVINVLLIEDDAIDQIVFKRFIKNAGCNYNVSYACSVKTAKEFLENNNYDVVIVDYFLGDGTAFDLMDCFGNIPVIFTTGVGDEETAVRAMKAGIYDYIIKDVDRNYIKLFPLAIENTLKIKRDKENLKMLSQAITAVNDSVYICNINCEVTFVNKVFLQTYGYNENEILGKNCSILWSDMSSFENAKTVLLDKGIGEFTHKCKDGSIFPIQISRSIIKDSNGIDSRIINVVRDISERKQAEEIILLEKEKAQSYLDIAGIMLIMVNKDLNITMINRKGCEVLGYDKSEVLGKNWFDIFIPENERDAFKFKFLNWMKEKSDEFDYFENAIVTKNGNEKTIAWNNILLKDINGNITEVLSSGEDITMRIEMDKTKTEFVNTVSHEIRTPLTVILGLCQMLLSKEDLEKDKLKEYFNIMYSESSRLSELVNDYLDIQRMENGRQVFQKSIMSIEDVVDDTIEIYASNETHTVTLDMDELTYSPIFADYNKIKQVITNLLSNAIKYSPEANEVVIKVRESNDLIKVSIIDYGLGIPEDCIPNLFNKFYRVNLSSHRKIVGTGLGLAICKEIITVHNGEIGVKSTVGKGSEFYFEIPVIKENK
jgi:PAS domain S-box-containing protein